MSSKILQKLSNSAGKAMKFQINVTSDTVCPWCYVGYKKLQAGIDAYNKAHPDAQDTFSIEWEPFYLNPNAPSPGVDKHEYIVQRFGSRERVEQAHKRLSAEGQKVGIDFKYGGKTGRTRDSHRLLGLGKSKGPETQNRVVKELFADYFEREKDITDHQVLEEAGVRAGLARDEIKSWLSSEDSGKEVDKEVQKAQARLVTGVPNFVIQDKYEIQGAQDPEGFKTVFERIKAAES